MKTKFLLIAASGIVLSMNVNAQNISINSNGASNSTSSMLEVLQPSTTNNTKSLFVRHSGNITGTGYGLWSEVTGTSTTNIAGYFSTSGSTNKYAIIVPSAGGNVGFGTTSPTANLHIVQAVTATGALTGIVYTGAVNTNQTASTEIPSLTLTTSGRQWATGALATQREVLITQPVYSFVGASTITNAATLGIEGAPVKSTNATITNSHACLIQAGAVSTATNSYGLTVNTQTGATNNYSAAFLGGNVGVGTAAPGYIFHAAGTAASTSTTYSSASSASSNGIKGENTAASGTTAGGFGVYGITVQGTSAGSLGGAGVIGLNSHANGVGLIGVGNNLGTYVQPNPTASGCGGIFYGTRYGLYAANSNTTSTGSGFSDGQTYSAIVATNATTSASSSLYNFAIHAYSSCNASAGRLAAILGIRVSGDWASLGYFSSASTSYGIFYSSALSGTRGWKTTGGEVAQPAYNIGMGGCGDLMGSWTRGNIYGMMVKGKRYSLYVDGATYTNNVIAQLNDNGAGVARTVSYVPTSTTVDIYTKGTAVLMEGKAFVKFDEAYTKMISFETPVIVTVTPMGESKGVYIESVSERGFTIKENGGGTSNIRLSWIAVGTKKGCDKLETPSELLAPDYDVNMNDVMFNENIKERNAKPMWWDGEKLRFDKPVKNLAQKEF